MPRRTASDLDLAALHALMRRQSGVVASWQVHHLGGTRNDIRGRVARREWQQVHPGVHVDHTGPLTRRQREWAAVLRYWPAALHRESALAAHGMTRDRGTPSATVHLMVDESRRVVATPGITVERIVDAGSWVQPHRSPPRARVELALLKTASSCDEAGGIALLSDAVHQGLTTADRLVSALDRLPRLPRRAFLLEVLRDVAAGSRSVLEHRYLRDVERAHGLPRGRRQVRQHTPYGTVCRDVAYGGQHALVELDGAFGHRDAVDRWADLERDLDAAVEGRVTLRPGWAQVLEPCRLADVVARVLQARGWVGRPRRCGPGCLLDVGGSGPT